MTMRFGSPTRERERVPAWDSLQETVPLCSHKSMKRRRTSALDVVWTWYIANALATSYSDSRTGRNSTPCGTEPNPLDHGFYQRSRSSASGFRGESPAIPPGGRLPCLRRRRTRSVVHPHLSWEEAGFGFVNEVRQPRLAMSFACVQPLAEEMQFVVARESLQHRPQHLDPVGRAWREWRHHLPDLRCEGVGVCLPALLAVEPRRPLVVTVGGVDDPCSDLPLVVGPVVSEDLHQHVSQEWECQPTDVIGAMPVVERFFYRGGFTVTSSFFIIRRFGWRRNQRRCVVALSCFFTQSEVVGSREKSRPW